MSTRPGDEDEVRASSHFALIAGLALSPWILLALLLPSGAIGWLGFGLDVAVLVALAACRMRAVPMLWPRAVVAALGGIVLASSLRFLVMPLWPGDDAPGAIPTVEAVGETLSRTLSYLAGLTLLHLLATGLLATLLLLSLGRAARGR